ncbi:MAG: tetratricopeptide repeat protein [Planctomycetes bacterium]|nr:tetratricopeptide repeat protein [Planctomycetota bacterium]
MQHQDEDLVQARILEAGMALEPATPFLELAITDLTPGERTQAEAFCANAPSLYGYERDLERIFMVLDLAVSAIQADPTFGGGYALSAACIYRLGVLDIDVYDSRALTASIPWAFRAIKMDPENEAGWEAYVETHCYKGDFTTAENALGEIYQRFGDNDLYARTAFLYFRLQGDTAQAVNWGALAWQTEWDTIRLVHTLFALGHLYRDVGEFSKAADAYRVITERDHNNAWAYHYLARSLAELGDYAAALDANQRAVKLGQLHEFRAFHEDLKRGHGRARMGATNAPTRGTGMYAKPPVVPAPPPASGKIVAAPPPASGKVVPAPPSRREEIVPAPPAKGPAKRPSTRQIPAPPQTRKVQAPPPAKKTVAPPPAKRPPPKKKP